MKNIVNDKKKKYLFIMIPMILLVLVVSISFAIFLRYSSQASTNTFGTLTCLSTSLTDVTGAISLTNEYPIPTEEGMTKNPYTFKITNNCNKNAEVWISLEVLGTSTIAPQYIRGAINPKGSKSDTGNILTNYQNGELYVGGTTNHILTKVIIEANKFKEYDLRIWLDEATTTAQGANKNFNAKIVLVANPTEEGEPAHITINFPSTIAGTFNSDFAGATWNAEKGRLQLSSINSTNQIINLTAGSSSGVNLATHIMSLSNAEGVYNEPATDFRYEGKNPNNYILFNNEIWRIIGVFSDNTHGKTGQKLVKIIRNESIGGLVWQKNNLNDWNHATSSLNKLLNEYYYNGINETTVTHCYGSDTTVQANCDFTNNGITNTYYRSMIENVTWKLGGIASMANNVGTVYTAERGTTVSSGRPTEATGYIGLMYPSDYGYSSSACGRAVNLSSYNSAACAGQAWLYGQGNEWTLMPSSSSASSVWKVYYNGSLYSSSARYGYSVRPVLYLSSGTTKIAGDGSIGNPYIIKNS